MSGFEADRVFSEAPSPFGGTISEIILHLKMLQTTSPFLRNFLSTLEQQLKSWDAGGNRVHLAGNIERTIRAIENLRQPAA